MPIDLNRPAGAREIHKKICCYVQIQNSTENKSAKNPPQSMVGSPWTSTIFCGVLLAAVIKIFVDYVYQRCLNNS